MSGGTFMDAVKSLSRSLSTDVVNVSMVHGMGFPVRMRADVVRAVEMARVNGAVFLYSEREQGGFVYWERVAVTGKAVVVRWLLEELDLIYARGRQGL